MILGSSISFLLFSESWPGIAVQYFSNLMYASSIQQIKRFLVGLIRVIYALLQPIERAANFYGINL